MKRLMQKLFDKNRTRPNRPNRKLPMWSLITKRGNALFLSLVIMFGVVQVPLQVYAASNFDPTSARYAGPLPTLHTKQTLAADAVAPTPGHVQNGPLVTDNTPLQGPAPKKPTYQPHELTNLRTATQSVMLNKDGSRTLKDYVTPHYYKVNGQYQTIDTSLVEDTNAGDGSNPISRAYGKVSSLFSAPHTFKVKANSWLARFAPSNFKQGMVRVEQGTSQIGYVPLHAAKVNPVITTKGGVETVTYPNVWRGVDLAYTVTSTELKENIILHDKDAVNQVQFKLVGGQLVSTGSDGSFKIVDALGNDFSIAAPNLMLNNLGPAMDAKGSLTQTANGNIITVTLNEKYLQQLPARAFPAVIDPTTFNSSFGTRAGGGNYVSFKTDGTICYSNVCNLYAGSLYDSNYYLQYWRGAFHSAYDQLRASNTVLMHANLHLTQLTNQSFWTGTYGTHNFQIGHATCLNSFNCVDGVWYTVNLATVGDVDVTSMYQTVIRNGDFGAWLMVMGEDGTDSSFKNFDPDNTYVTFTYDTIPPAPKVTSPSVDNQVFVDPQVSFSTNTVSDADGDPVQYSFRIATGSDGQTGTVINSGNLSSNQWTVPDGVLQDGTTYYLTAYTWDGYNQSAASAVRPFKIDSRRGQDKTQTYDTVGPTTVDLATGNLSTSISSHTSAALAGSLGASLTYNSPIRSRHGLVGQYWNVASGYSGGAPTSAPVMTRVDSNIDYNWSTGSPASGTINNDWFFAHWDGYFVAPVAGTYSFGGNNDDLLSVSMATDPTNPTQFQNLYSNGGCYSGVCYGSSVTLAAGQIVPLKVDYKEATGPAYAHFYVKGPVNPQVVPSAWLYTGPRAIDQQSGLIGHYYTDDGTHNLDGPNKSLFLSRTDPLLSFNWGTGSPIPNGPTDNFMVRWTGYLTVPTSGNYQFGTISDDGSRITIGSTQVFSKWSDDGGSEQYGTTIALMAGTSVPITVDYYEHGGGASMYLRVKGDNLPAQTVPSGWLSPKAQVLPSGWQLGIDPDGNVSYDHLEANQSGVTLMDSTGDTHEYKWNNHGGYTPPVNEDGQLARNPDGTFTLIDTDGRTYVFGADGLLQSVTSPVDDLHPAALQYIYSGSPSKIVKIVDGVDPARYAAVYYTGDSNCGAIPAGYDSGSTATSLDANYVCAVVTNDGRATYFYYAGGLLSRIARPGNDYTDYQYDQYNRIANIRDSLANDVIAAGLRTAGDLTTETQITYDAIGRVASATPPTANTSDTPTVYSYNYQASTVPLSRYINGSGEHTASVSQGPPPGYSLEATFGSLLLNQAAGTHALYSCLIGSDEFTSPSSTCEGQTVVGLLGYAYDSAPVGQASVAVYRCAINGEHFDSTSPNCEGYKVQLTLGYLLSGVGNAGYTLSHESGVSEPNGYSERADYDSLFRTLIDTDVTGQATKTVWDPAKDLQYSVTDPSGLMSTTIYDNDDRPVSQYGPAPAAWFGADRTPLSSYAAQVPRTDSGYDQGITGPAVAYMKLSTPVINDTLGSGQALTKGQSIYSQDHRFTFIYQSDGNVVLYGPSGPALWNAGSAGKASDHLIMQADGNLVLYNGTTPVWYTGTGGKGVSRLVMQNDGNAVVYNSANTATWSSGTGGYEAVNTIPSSLTGAPLMHATNIGSPNPAQILHDFGTSSPVSGVSANWGMRLTGKMKLPTTGNWQFRIFSDNGVRMWIDDTLVIDDWANGVQRSHPVYAYNNIDTTTLHRFRIDYYHTTGDANFALYATPPGGSETASTAQYFLPDYSLPTSETTYDSTYGNTTTTTNYGPNPELGNPVSQSVDSTGLNLTSSSTYETQGVSGSYLRQLTSTLPGGATTNYAYYGATETADNPCTTTQTEAFHEGGMLKLKTEPDPDGSGSQTGRTTQAVYDDAGRIVATRINQDPWTCTTYDARGRLLTTVIPTINGQAGRTITNNYAVGGNPLIASSGDSSGTITIQTDLLGRDVKYSDALGNVTTSNYDPKGNLLSRSSPLGTEDFVYDTYNRLTDQKLNGAVQAHINYDQYSRITSVTYPSAGAQQVVYSRDTLGRLSGLTYTTGDGHTISDAVTRSQSNEISSGTENGLAKSYTYDTAGRLTGATIGTNTYSYSFSPITSTTCPQVSANLNAGKESNRTQLTVNGQVTTYCYNQADQLISSSDPTIAQPTYDAHGNTTQLGLATATLTKFTYDSSDRNSGIEQDVSGAKGAINANTVAYTRDVQGRITSRMTGTKVTANNGKVTSTTTGTTKYGFTASGDTPDFALNASNQVVEKYLQLPGNVLLTIRPTKTGAAAAVYSLPNIHGDIFATTGATGILTSTFVTGPFGEQVAGQNLQDNTQAGSSFGYVGQNEKITESALALQPTEMGARVYLPTLGRFMQVDPVQGGTPNNYTYPDNPVDDFDLSGQISLLRSIGVGAAAIGAGLGVAGCVVATAGICAGVLGTVAVSGGIGAAGGAAAYSSAYAGTPSFSGGGLAMSAGLSGAGSSLIAAGGLFAPRVLPGLPKYNIKIDAPNHQWNGAFKKHIQINRWNPPRTSIRIPYGKSYRGPTSSRVAFNRVERAVRWIFSRIFR